MEGTTILAWRARETLRKPDATNYQKAAEDAFQGILYWNDSQVTDVRSVKSYAKDGIGLTVIWLEEA